MTTGRPTVPTYTLTRYQGHAEPHTVTCEDYVSDDDAIADARAALVIWSVETAERPLFVAVGRGRDADVEWLGAWDLEEGKPVWTPDD